MNGERILQNIRTSQEVRKLTIQSNGEEKIQSLLGLGSQFQNLRKQFRIIEQFYIAVLQL
jgi:hypothetical protein